MEKSEFIIIGFGKGGKTLASVLGNKGHTVTLFEKDKKMYGGTCINVACIPTKALVFESEESFRLGGTYEDRNKRFKDAINKKDALTSALRKKNYDKLAANPNIKVIDGEASFIDDHTVIANGEEYKGDTIIIDTGSRPFIPPIQGVDNKHVFTSETMLDISYLPKHLVIVGGGYIGLEFASMFINFGSKVTMIQNGLEFLERDDKDISKAIEDDFISRGLTLIKGASVKKIDEKNGEVSVYASFSDKEDEVIKGDAVLLATGRRPNINNLNLEKAGVELTSRGGIKVNEHNLTSKPNIYAVGDVAGGLQFTYISLDDSRIVLSDILKDEKRTNLNRGQVPYSLFIDPPFSRIGLTEKEAREKYEVLIGILPMKAVPKAHILQNDKGLMKVIIDKNTHLILGAHLYSVESYELINTIKMAMDNKIPCEYLRDNIYTHPTMSEAFNDLFANLK